MVSMRVHNLKIEWSEVYLFFVLVHKSALYWVLRQVIIVRQRQSYIPGVRAFARRIGSPFFYSLPNQNVRYPGLCTRLMK